MASTTLRASLALAFAAALVGGCTSAAPDADPTSEESALVPPGPGHASVSAPRDVVVACNAPGDAMQSYQGVVAYCNDRQASGVYQCDQYANRFVSSLDLPPVDDWVTNAACEICDRVSTDPELRRYYSVWGPGYRSTAGHEPGPNDLLVWSDNGTCVPGDEASPGHVAVVTGSDARSVRYIQQNWMLRESVDGSAYAGLVRSWAAWDTSASFFGTADGPGGHLQPRCWVHPECPPGKPCNPGPHHNPCRNVSHADNGQYCATSTQAGFDATAALPDVLYECIDGQIANETRCPAGCTIAPPGQPDGCAAP